MRSQVRAMVVGASVALLFILGSNQLALAIDARPRPQRTLAAAEPSGVVKEAFDLLLDRSVTLPDFVVLLNAGWDAARAAVQQAGAPGLSDQRPTFTGDRAADWRTFAEAYANLAAAAGGSLEPWQLDRATIQGMVTSINAPNTRYLSPEQSNTLSAQTQYGGVGVRPRQDLIVVEVFPGSPAEAGGLQLGDQIIAVDGASVEGMPTEDVAIRIRGPVGTTVELTVRRGTADPLILPIVRQQITTEWLTWRVLEGGIGYLRIRGFPAPDASSAFGLAVEGLLAGGTQALVIDLRGGGAGFLATARQIASRFIRQAPLWQEVDRGGVARTTTTDGSYWGRDMPIVVLVDQGTRSQGELLAAALRESGVAQLIGTRTAGQATAAQMFPLSDGSRLQVTIRTIKSGQGQVVDGVGVDPDQITELDAQQLRLGQDSQLEAGVTVLRQKPR